MRSMLFRTLILAPVAALAACGNGSQVSAQPAAASDPEAWTIGPIIRGRNHSRGGKLSNLSIRTQHDIEQHSFVLLEPPAANVRSSATKGVETTCERADV